MPENQWPQIQPGKPACYRIAVMGCLNENWSGRLSGMQIATSQQGEQQNDQQVTVLTGQVQDQADLMGVLNTLYQLRMNILSVICEPCNQPEDGSGKGVGPQ